MISATYVKSGVTSWITIPATNGVNIAVLCHTAPRFVQVVAWLKNISVQVIISAEESTNRVGLSSCASGLTLPQVEIHADCAALLLASLVAWIRVHVTRAIQISLQIALLYKHRASIVNHIALHDTVTTLWSA